MITRIYAYLHRLFAKPEERGEWSSGYWQNIVRRETLLLCRETRGRILEVGCGEGLFLTQLVGQNKNIEVWGVDNYSITFERVKQRCRQKNLENINLFFQDATSLSFADEYFDTVICINVFLDLGSLEAVRKVLKEMARVCKKNGKLIMDFRNSANPLIPLKYKLAPLYDPTVKHIKLKGFGLEEMSLIVEEAGLKITKKIYAGFPVKKIAPIVILEAERL